MEISVDDLERFCADVECYFEGSLLPLIAMSNMSPDIARSVVTSLERIKTGLKAVAFFQGCHGLQSFTELHREDSC